MLEVRDAVARYGERTALRELSLDVAEGELLCVLGASGSGKSTLLRAVCGLVPLQAGTIRIGGDDVTRAAPERRGVAMVFQSFALFPHLDVERNIGFGLRARGGNRAQVAERVRAVARSLGLADLLGRRPSELSGGERQRVALARGLVGSPRVLLLDEPLSNLDAQLRVALRGELRRIHDETGLTTVHVTHDQSEALALGDRVALLRDGRIEQLGTPDELWERPSTAWAAAFLGTPPMNLVAPEALGVGADGAALVGFRPEHAGARADPGGHARFVRAERTGAERFWHLDVGGTPIAVRAPDAEPPEPGARVALELSVVRRFGAGGRAL